MNDNLFTGKLTRLTAEDPGTMAKAFALWSRNSEYARLFEDEPIKMFSGKQWKDWLEKALDKEQPREIAFAIRSLLDEKLIGFVAFWGINWVRAESWLAMAIGEAELWGKGYGTDALQVFLRFAFQELNFRRVSLFAFEYNERALRAYQKCGFRLEGRRRKHINRMGKRWDSLFMGLLKEEWEDLSKTL